MLRHEGDNRTEVHMRLNSVGFLTLACLMAGSSCRERSRLAESSTHRIGVYDSRSIAIAYCGTEPHERRTKALLDALERAKQSGDEARIKACDQAVWEARKRLHRQGFSTAPVDDILKEIEDRIPSIQDEAGVSAIVSKWNEEALEKHPDALQIDVTDLLVRELHPIPRQLRYAEDIRSKAPISAEEIERHLAEDGI